MQRRNLSKGGACKWHVRGQNYRCPPKLEGDGKESLFFKAYGFQEGGKYYYISKVREITLHCFCY